MRHSVPDARRRLGLVSVGLALILAAGSARAAVRDDPPIPTIDANHDPRRWHAGGAPAPALPAGEVATRVARALVAWIDGARHAPRLVSQIERLWQACEHGPCASARREGASDSRRDRPAIPGGSRTQVSLPPWCSCCKPQRPEHRMIDKSDHKRTLVVTRTPPARTRPNTACVASPLDLLRLLEQERDGISTVVLTGNFASMRELTLFLVDQYPALRILSGRADEEPDTYLPAFS